MRLLLFITVLALNPIALSGQSLPEWSRVYTFDESTIEMNTTLLTPISKDVTRVRFRWTFDQPQSLGGLPEIRYKSELEVMEFNCSLNRYRPYHFTFFDSSGNIVRIQDSPGEWRTIAPGSMIEKLFASGCDLIKEKTRPNPAADEQAQLERVELFAYDFAQHLERTKDFKLLTARFFVSNYLDGYLHDKQTNWFLNLKRDTAAKLSREELQRFYIALMNAGYLNSLYVISQLASDSASLATLIPPDVLKLVKNHPYTARYKSREGDYEFLGEDIDRVERLRSYTDLLERISSLLRGHVKRVRADQSKEWQAMLQHWNLFQPKIRVCAENCFGLPTGTRVFEVNVPVFNLQVAEIKGNLKVVSAISRF
jgi:Surface-adhesin protein E